MFSPYYAWARRRGPGDPYRHIALNVALYGERKGWALTERGRNALDRGPDFLSLGPSSLMWEGGVLTIRIDEITAPLPSRIRGVVRIHPEAIEQEVRMLDAVGRHRWCPIAPCARAEIALETPSLRWTGPAYFDTNGGDAPLEVDFSSWTWSRSPIAGGTEVFYDITRRDGSTASLAMRYDRAGGVTDIPPPEPVDLTRTKWGLARSSRATSGLAKVAQTLEDTPFYARSILATASGPTMHESLSLDRFRKPWVQAMLPFRIPRALW